MVSRIETKVGIRASAVGREHTLFSMSCKVTVYNYCRRGLPDAECSTLTPSQMTKLSFRKALQEAWRPPASAKSGCAKSAVKASRKSASGDATMNPCQGESDLSGSAPGRLSQNRDCHKRGPNQSLMCKDLHEARLTVPAFFHAFQ